jgi:hypothetical protein
LNGCQRVDRMSFRTQEAADTGISRRGFLGFVAASIFLAQAEQQSARLESRNGIPYRTLGRTKEKVSLIGLAGYHLGKQADPQESMGIIRTGLDESINFLNNRWDTTAARVKSAVLLHVCTTVRLRDMPILLIWRRPQKSSESPYEQGWI